MDPVKDTADTLFSSIGLIYEQLHDQLAWVLIPGWRQYQVLIVLGLVLMAWLMKALLQPRLENWARSREGWPKWRLRMIVQVRQRLGLISFAVIAWVTYWTMQHVTWPSRSYLIGLAATLATFWIVIGLVTRLVRNPSVRRFVRWGLWIYATLYALDLDDEATEFLDGFAITFGDMKLSVLVLLKAVILIWVLLVGARLFTRVAESGFRRNEDISPSMQELATKAVQVFAYGLVFMMGIRALGFDLTGLAFLSGAIGVGIGFGLQKVVSNLISGIIILLDKSIKPGDVISLGDTFGWINSLGARYVSVVTRDGREYLIPNEDLITGQVVNWSHSDEFVRLDIYFGTAYCDDPHLVRKVAVEAAQGVTRVLSHPNAPVCHIVGFGDSSVDYILRFWIRDPTKGLTNIRGNVYLALWDAFQAKGISIPFPQREVRMLKETAG
ncbi:mechanosensitive ion channel [Sedimentitalea sp. JM2-8]|uniref:Mechanosensitive ion channel n=1 Tax=Sedimentitalea xiamensis TaxID=3050037 RepID=A0ABT7FJ93_9RHOB|nr:mechanosensitive ion channel domain-containing protein [Sedimentitalea xiamensis]MDK3075186.1 mechanosensitive ion channel [Sedimentitalea xiamensis]